MACSAVGGCLDMSSVWVSQEDCFKFEASLGKKGRERKDLPSHRAPQVNPNIALLSICGAHSRQASFSHCLLPDNTPTIPGAS